MTPSLPQAEGPPVAPPPERRKVESLDQAVQAFAALLLAGLRNALIYSPTHSQFQLALSKAEEMAAIAAGFTPEIVFICLEKELFVGGKPMNKRGMQFQRLADFMHSLGVQRLIVSPGLTAAELKGFALNLIGLTEGGESSGKKVLRATPHIRVGRLKRQDTDDGEGLEAPVYDLDEGFTAVAGGAGGSGEPTGSGASGPPGGLPGTDGEAAGSTGPATRRGGRTSKAEVDAARREMAACEKALRLVIDLAKRAGYLTLLGALRQYHAPTYLHSMNVALLAATHAGLLKVPPQLLQDIVVAGLLHDLGKLALPKALLAKTGPRSPDEERIYQQHCLAGAQLLTRYPAVPPLAIMAAFEHHLYAGGDGGFPQGRRVAEPHLLSQLVGLANFYDNARMPKPGQPPLTLQAILQQIQEDPKRFHPSLTINFPEAVAAFEPVSGC